MLSKEITSPVFLVDAYSDPVYLKIKGRANYLNSGPLNDFFSKTIKKNKANLVIDFEECIGMDSTFLGLLASVALELRKPEHKRSISLCNLKGRNLELIENLGLDRILKVNPSDFKESSINDTINTLKVFETSKSAPTEVIFKAHQSLIEANPSNFPKFQDVLSFLKKQVDQDH